MWRKKIPPTCWAIWCRKVCSCCWCCKGCRYSVSLKSWSKGCIKQKHYLKGQSHEIFVVSFFPQTAPPGLIRDVLGPFWFFLLLGWVISILKWLPSVLCTGESFFVSLNLHVHATALKQHSFKKLSNISIYYTNIVQTCFKLFLITRFLGRLPGVPSTGESF